MNPYSQDELAYYRQLVGDQGRGQVAPTSNDLQLVFDNGAYQPQSLTISPSVANQLEQLGIFNLIRTLQYQMDTADRAMGVVSPQSVMNQDQLPAGYQSVYPPAGNAVDAGSAVMVLP